MGIEINIKAGLDVSSSNVSTSGNIQHIITDIERSTFGINDLDIKDAVEKYFGRRPNDAFLHSPTPWDDLYKNYGWLQVQTYLYPKSSTITGITSESAVLATKTFSNNSNKREKFNCGISKQVTNVIKTNWSHINMLSTEQKFRYIIEFLGAGGGIDATLFYEDKWGQHGSESKDITVGTSSAVEVELNPNESVEAVLTANKCIMKIKIVYTAYLDGDIAVNYNPSYKDHHFWGLWITNVMNAKGLSTMREFTEEVEIEYYINLKTELINPENRDIKAVFVSNDKAAV